MSNGQFSSIKPRDLLKTHNRDLVAKVSALWDRYVAPEKDYMERDNVILEDVGHWLKQSAWTDETGYYIKLRLHPSYNHQAKVQEAARKVVQGFIDLFPGRKEVFKEGHLALEDGTTDTVTVVVQTGSHSIGD